MTDTAALRKLLEEATPNLGNGYEGAFSAAQFIGPYILRHDAQISLEQSRKDRALIVAAVNNLSSLLDEVETLRRDCEFYRKKMDEAKGREIDLGAGDGRSD